MASEQIKDRQEPPTSRVKPPVVLVPHPEKIGLLWRFSQPTQVIRAGTAPEVGSALAAINRAVAAGSFVAGWLGYELGYALEPRLHHLQWPARDEPLLWLGVFGAPEEVAADSPGEAGRSYAGPLHHAWDEAAYASRFGAARDYIAAGDIYQVNLSFRSRFRFVGDPLGLWLALRAKAEAPYAAYVDDGERKVLSLSPELFFGVEASGRITARPMKGTAPRGEDASSDIAAKDALAASPKERAENLMIVDLLRNDLGRVARTGSVGVRDLFAVETYPTLHTMVSTVTAKLRAGTTPEAITRALFPCGSVTGAPKIRAMEVIQELEASPRGAYCGAIGYFAPNGSAAFNVAIRTITLRGNEGELGIGGAVVADSNASGEYAECLLKARYFEQGRKSLGLIETLRFENGFVRLEQHLARMAASASFFGLPFDREVALRTVHAAAGDAKDARRVRLTLDEAGHFNGTAAPLEAAAASWTYALSPVVQSSSDPLLRHKTTWRESYDAEHARLSALTRCDEVLFVNERGELTEGSRTNIFVRRGDRLFTPALDCGLLDGILRRALLDRGGCEEAVLTPHDLHGAGQVFVGNSLRGLIDAKPIS